MKLTVTEAARLLAVPEQEVYDWMRTRGLPYVKIQDRRYIHRARLHAWAREHQVPLHPDVFQETTGVGDVFGAELADALRHGALARLPTPTGQREGALATVEALRLPASVDREALSEVVAARRDLGFVVDAHGVGLPLLSEPILAAGPPALFLLAFEPGWGLGGGRVRRLFVLVAPTVRVHQRLLAELDAMLHHPGFREAVLLARTADDLADLARQTERPAPTPIPAHAAG